MSTTTTVQGYKTFDHPNETSRLQSVIDAQNGVIIMNDQRVVEIQREAIQAHQQNIELAKKLSELEEKTSTLKSNIENERAQIKNLTALVKSNSMSDEKKVGLAILAIVVTAVVIVGVTYSVIHFGSLGK